MKNTIYISSASFKANANCDEETYLRLYQESLNDPDTFWRNQAASLDWIKPFTGVHTSNLHKGEASWFINGELNVAVNCIDRHLPKRAEQTAIIWEGDNPNEHQHISYQELSNRVNSLANGLKEKGVKKGDRVCIYMPMIPEAAYAMLACARIGAIHSVVFGGFSPDALRDRIVDATCTVVITADEGVRGNKKIPLKANVDKAISNVDCVKHVIVVKRTGGNIEWNSQRDVWYHELIAKQSVNCPPEPIKSEDPLFILYTSGSTGKPKGVLHTTAGYLLYTSLTHRYVLDYREGDIYWCTADVGWITGHSYILYGPLANGATTVMFEGIPTYPDASRCWQICDKHSVSIFYTAPTAIRALMAQGDEWVKQHKRTSLRLLGTVGEPINPEAWEWYYHVVGEGRCPIVDTWWQTETGGIMIAPIPGAIDQKPGSATRPFFGIEPVLLDEKGKEIEGQGQGILAIKRSWPSQIRTVFGDHDRCIQTYFTAYPGYYFTGDGATRDEDGFYWITGRVDDVINVSGHRIGTAEVESALVLHPTVAEAAVVGYPHSIKGQGILAYVTLMNGIEPSDSLSQELIKQVASEIGSFAKPDIIIWTAALPKTRSGKIMRRILRKIGEGDTKNLGDTSTLADPTVVESLIASVNERLKFQ